MTNLTRAIGIAAIIGGTLRIATELLARTGLSDPSLQQLYFVTDFALLLGIGGVYALTSTRTGLFGAVAFVVFVFGILLVRSPNVSLLGPQGYRTGAAIALFGVASLGAAMLYGSALRIAPHFWFAALSVRLAGAMGLRTDVLILMTGLLFGLGTASAGVETLRFRSP
jgi:hypothetical protein